MDNIIFYKLRKFNNHWVVVFLDNKTNESIIIKDDPTLLKYFLEDRKDSILVGANNYTNDDILLTSLVKNSNLTGEVNDDDITKYLPITLDVSQGIVRNSLIDYNNMVSTLWDNNGNALSYNYALSLEDIKKQLVADVQIIKNFYKMNERKNFLKWKVDVINKYHLGKETYHYSYGDIMRTILGLNIKNETRSRRISLDKKLEQALKKKNDPFLNELLETLKKYYSHNESEKLQIKIGDCLVNFNEQGILGSMEDSLIDTNTKSPYAYLYIDFNSFGPNILINNNWLDGVAKNPKRYSEIKDLRISLKAQKQVEQLYYKYMLNSGLDYLNRVATKDGKNIGLSLTMSGIMTMMLLYKNIEEFKTELIECNTDGLIVKCPRNMINNIKNEVKKLEELLSLSCDVDVIKKIVHFDTKNYVMEFEDGKQKHLGVFGAFQTNPLYCSGISAVELALREYYLNGTPVSMTLRKLRNEGNLESFQIVKKQKKNERAKYVNINDEYFLYDRSTSRLFAVRQEVIKNPFYVKNPKGNFEEYKTKRGRSVKDGYYHFELSDKSLPSIHDIDLTYYIDECYKVINNHPITKVPMINLDLPKMNCFVDLDGTLIKDKDYDTAYLTFYKAVDGILKNEEIPAAYELFGRQGGYLVQFLGICKKYKAYGTIDNFANYLEDMNLFPGKSFKEYKHFVTNYIKYDIESSINLESFNGSKELLEYLKSENCNIMLYSNWFKKVQNAKLESHGFMPYFSEVCTIDDYYAKSSVKGWEDLLNGVNVNQDSINIMIGNSSNDVAPKSVNVSSVIINHTDKKPAKAVLANGIIVNSFSEITNRNFYPELVKIKRIK